MRAATVMLFLLLIGCQGPPAPDPALCRDAIHRLCIPTVCPAVVPLFTAAAGCEGTLLAATGCSSEEFVFSSPSRDRFLSCRLALLRAGGNPEDHPSCEDVDELFDRCPDLVRMFQGIK